MSATRRDWEPARTPYFFPALATGQTVFSGEHIVHAIVATNLGAAETTMAVFANGSQIGTVAVPAGETAQLTVPASGLLVRALSVTPAAALDVTVLTA